MNPSRLSNTVASVIMNSTINSIALNTNQTNTKTVPEHKRSKTINSGRSLNPNIMPNSRTIKDEGSQCPTSAKRNGYNDSINGFKVKHVFGL